jgi:hypothetical protein
VVIAIIALLVSILLPTLSRAKRLAEQTVCLTNVRRLTYSLRMYTEDYDGCFPPDRWRDASMYVQVGKYKRYRPRWIWFLSEHAGPVINPSNYASEAAFNQALEMDNDYFLCPGFKHHKYMRSLRNGAYGYNFQYLANTRGAPPGERGPMANYPNYIDEIRMPAKCIAFTDSRGSDIPHGEHGYCVDPPKMALSRGARHFSPKSPAVGPLKYSPADARHLDRASTGFLDGHGEAMTYEEMGYHVDSDTGRPVEKPLTENGDRRGDNTLWTGTGHDEPD